MLRGVWPRCASGVAHALAVVACWHQRLAACLLVFGSRILFGVSDAPDFALPEPGTD